MRYELNIFSFVALFAGSKDDEKELPNEEQQS